MAKRTLGQLIDGWLALSEELVVGLDRSGGVQFASQRFLDIYPDLKEGVVFWSGLELDALVRWVSECFDSTEPQVREQVLAHRPGELWMGRLDPILGVSGGCTGWILRLKDIQPVERLSQRLDALMQEVSHRLREPLVGMKSRLEVLLEGGEKDAELAHRLLREINDDSNQLVRLLFSLDGPAQGGVANSVPMEIEASTMIETCEQVFATFEPLARGKNLALKLDIESPLRGNLAFTLDELERCLINLVDNAVKSTACKGYGHVNIKVKSDTLGPMPGVHLRVEDSGPGIPEACRELVFEQFYRLSEGPTAELGGTGLGLWRVREIAAQRGGWVRAGESALGGASVDLFLPYKS